MCEKRDSIRLMSAAADRLAEACEAKIHATNSGIDPANPVKSGVSAAVRKAFRNLSTTPADMAVQLKKLDGRGSCSKR